MEAPDFTYLQIFNAAEANEIYDYLEDKEIEYHKPYKRYNKTVKVPRGQASYTFDSSIHYNYGVSGGSPINEVMDDRMKAITCKVNDALGTNYNTILMNVYKHGKDSIGLHQDKEVGWVENTGFATLSFGAERVFLLENNETKQKTKIKHEKGHVINMPYPMNHNYKHGVPPCSTKDCRISLTFREIKPHTII